MAFHQRLGLLAKRPLLLAEAGEGIAKMDGRGIELASFSLSGDEEIDAIQDMVLGRFMAIHLS